MSRSKVKIITQKIYAGNVIIRFCSRHRFGHVFTWNKDGGPEAACWRENSKFRFLILLDAAVYPVTTANGEC